MIIMTINKAVVFSTHRDNIKPILLVISFIMMIFHSAFAIIINDASQFFSGWYFSLFDSMVYSLSGKFLFRSFIIFFISFLSFWGIIVPFLSGFTLLSSSIPGCISVDLFLWPTLSHRCRLNGLSNWNCQLIIALYSRGLK